MVQPSKTVLEAFGAAGTPSPLAGGQDENFRSGDTVFKPAKNDEETNWLAKFYSSADQDGFRLPKPIRSNIGGFVFDGWQAWEFLEGEHRENHWLETIEVCVQFHNAISKYPIPEYFERREQNPWVVADKLTFGEIDEIEYHPKIAPAVKALRSCLKPIEQHPQLIHGDFGGNVLFSENQPPAIIDFSPYWRPIPFAVGVVIADAIVWSGAKVSLIEAGGRFEDFDQHLARAELRRVIELETHRQIFGVDVIDQIDTHWPLIDTICRRCTT